ncbi:MAG TPA: hypothetical protein VFP84_18995, partial [Kofleriaceae bacterium]|nr:hypothetical protein [Kofleriaceae bacterium]
MRVEHDSASCAMDRLLRANHFLDEKGRFFRGFLFRDLTFHRFSKGGDLLMPVPTSENEVTMSIC